MQEVEADLLAWVLERMPDRLALLAGSSVHVDKTFLVCPFILAGVCVLMGENRRKICLSYMIICIIGYWTYHLSRVRTVFFRQFVAYKVAGSTEAVKRFHPDLQYRPENGGVTEEEKPHRYAPHLTCE